MISRLAGLIAAFSLAARCQTSPPTNDGAKHFYWSETNAHELDYEHTIATAKDLSQQERKDLLTFVLDRFHHPVNAHDEEMFEDISDDQMRKLAADTRIESVDLNGNGKKEIIAQGNGLGPCGGTGNCIVLVLQSTDAGWRTLLDSRAGKLGGGFEKIRVLGSTSNGFRDIVLASHDSADERTAILYRYDKGQYLEYQCYHINWSTFAGGYHRLSEPQTGPCAE